MSWQLPRIFLYQTKQPRAPGAAKIGWKHLQCGSRFVRNSRGRSGPAKIWRIDKFCRELHVGHREIYHGKEVEYLQQRCVFAPSPYFYSPVQWRVRMGQKCICPIYGTSNPPASLSEICGETRCKAIVNQQIEEGRISKGLHEGGKNGSWLLPRNIGGSFQCRRSWEGGAETNRVPGIYHHFFNNNSLFLITIFLLSDNASLNPLLFACCFSNSFHLDLPRIILYFLTFRSMKIYAQITLRYCYYHKYQRQGSFQKTFRI